MTIDFTKLFGEGGAVLGPTLLANGQNFSGKVGDLTLNADSARADRMFIFTDSQG